MAGAAFPSGGFGVLKSSCCWDRGYDVLRLPKLGPYASAGVGWMLHVGLDLLHHLYGNPIVPFAPDSSSGCAICDPVMFAWDVGLPVALRRGSAVPNRQLTVV